MKEFKETIIELPYGNEHITFSSNRGKKFIIEKSISEKSPLTNKEILEKIQNPIRSKRLSSLVKENETLIIVVPDATRYIGSRKIIRQILNLLESSNVYNKNISFLIGGGIHRNPTEDEIIQILGKAVAKQFKIYLHDANDEHSLAEIGTTKRGTKVKVNKQLVKADHVLQIGGISFHYIAGFSGGRKSILPGCGAETSIQQNHKLAFDSSNLKKSKGISSGKLEGNPVHEDMVEAVSFLNPTFAVNTILDSNKEIIDVYAGHWKYSHLQGCENYKKANSVVVKEKCSTVIVSAGGYPKDINLIQSHKAMEHASKILKSNGTMILVASCSQGLGREDLLDWFVPGGADGTAKKLLDNYKVYGQTAWGIRWKTEAFNVFLVSELADELLKQTGITACHSIESIIDNMNNSEQIYIMPNGLTTLPIISNN